MPELWASAIGAEYHVPGGVVGDVRYVRDDPAGLSRRAADFLNANSRRIDYDRGLTGAALRSAIQRVYGRPGDDIATLLDLIQARYGGLAYTSGFFNGPVQFTPICDPSDPAEELEILYTVDTGSPAGASVKADGEVEVGLDGEGVREFPNLDSLIECDAMFGSLNQPVTTVGHLDHHRVPVLVDRLRSDADLALRPIPEACGAHSTWLQGSSTAVFVTGVWGMLGGIVPASVRVWSTAADDIDRIRSHLQHL